LNYSRRQILQDSWVLFVSSRASWNMMATLTFASTTYEKSARHQLANYLQRLLSLDDGLIYFFCLEHNEYKECHFHGLFQTVIPKQVLELEWRHGFTKIEGITRKHDVLPYITKYITKEGSFFAENMQNCGLTNCKYQSTIPNISPSA